MAASYPSSVRVFTTKVNVTDSIDASHPNSVQEEVVAIQSTLGASPQTSTTPSSSGTFISTATAFSSVSARLSNIETGIVADTHTQYLKKSADGSNLITPSTASTKALVIKATSGQSVNLVEFQNSAGVVGSYVDSNGVLTSAGAANYVTLTGTETLTNKTLTAPIINFSINSQSGTSYALILADNGKVVTFDNSASIGIVVPPNSSVAYPIGAQITLVQLGTGQVTVGPGSGVTINGTPGLKLRARYSTAALLKVATDTWVLAGDLSA